MGKNALMVTEVEVYDGPKDLASHASHGKTKRTEVMFEAGGVWYVYLCYGMHFMLNIVTGEKDYPAAVLIRGAEHYVGPGKITKSLGIDKKFNTQPATRRTGLYFVDNPNVRHSMSNIKRLPRVGVSYAGPIWSKKKWRFKLILPTEA